MSKSFIIKIIIICLLTINAYAIEKIVLFGDSLMAGYGLSDDNSLPVVLEENLEAKGYNIEIVDGSVSGSTSSGGLNRADWTLSEPDIDLIILCLGANDMLRGIQPKETKSNLEKIEKIYLKADPNLINQALNNLFKNSIESLKEKDEKMGDFQKKIDVEIQLINEYINIVVQDNGIGFTNSDLRLFSKPYFTTKKTGTGLGLPIVTKIVNEHYGTLLINNKKNSC